MNKCSKVVGEDACNGSLIKFGRSKGRQRYRCKNCNVTQMGSYLHLAYQSYVNQQIVSHIKEGCGIRSIARLLNIACGTVVSRIKLIAGFIKRPSMESGGTYEVDELRTYIKDKRQECWVIYALDRQSGTVVDLRVGKRTKDNISQLTDGLLLANCKRIFTDRLNIYRYVIPSTKHTVKRYGTNRIERMNLNLRTHLKRLGRRTICYSKSRFMLEASLKIYFGLRHI